MSEFLDYVKATYPHHVLDVQTQHGEMVVITDAAHVVELLTALRDNENCLFKQLVDVCGVDYPARAQRFEVVYHLLSFKYNARIRVKLSVVEDVTVPTANDVFPAAGWFEREVWDMYGVSFENHPDMRRILTDYGFDGHPQRKDFPLSGYVELRYDMEQKRVVYEPVKLNQAYRNFDYTSPWESAASFDSKVVLPGDEKAVVK